MTPEAKTAAVRLGRRVPHQRLVIAAGVLASLGILSLLILKHVDALLGVGARIEWRWVAAAVACATASYAMVGLALEEVLALLGFALPFAEVLGIALVSTTANYFVSSAGVSGFALKAHLLRKRHVPYGTTVTASVLSSAILYCVLAVIVGEGLGYLFLHLQGTKIVIMESALGFAVLLATAVPLLAFFFNHRLRSRVAMKLFHWFNRGVYVFSKYEIPPEEFRLFEDQLARGLDRIRENKRRLTRTIAYTCLDWSFAMTTLYFAFRAVGIGLSVGHLSAGFTAGIAATLIPILPGGLGAVEGSMAAVYESLGIPWEQALVAVLLYRMAYYLLPGMMSIFVLWGLKISEPRWIEKGALGGLHPAASPGPAQLERKREKT